MLSHNAIEEIDEIELKPLTELRKLSLSHNLLRTVPNLSVGRMRCDAMRNEFNGGAGRLGPCLRLTHVNLASPAIAVLLQPQRVALE